MFVLTLKGVSNFLQRRISGGDFPLLPKFEIVLTKYHKQLTRTHEHEQLTRTLPHRMPSLAWEMALGTRTGLCQSYTDGLKECGSSSQPTAPSTRRGTAGWRARSPCSPRQVEQRKATVGGSWIVPSKGYEEERAERAARLERARKASEKWMEDRGDGFRAAPDPQGVPFLAADDWAGAVDGYIHKNGERGWGYYRTSPPPAEEKETFVHEGKIWETVKELTIEEAIAFKERVAVVFPEGNGREHLPGNASGNTMDDWSSSDEDQSSSNDEEDWSTATGDELDVAVFGEGILALPLLYAPGRITVFMDDEKTNTPFGMVETAPFLELLWRNTGADCAGEEEEMEFPGGSRYKVLLCESRSNL